MPFLLSSSLLSLHPQKHIIINHKTVNYNLKMEKFTTFKQIKR